MSTFSVGALLSILHKADAVPPGYCVGQPAAEFVGPSIGGSTFACCRVAKRVDGATDAENKNTVIPQQLDGCTKRHVLRRI
jgi:hypothetical protein